MKKLAFLMIILIYSFPAISRPLTEKFDKFSDYDRGGLLYLGDYELKGPVYQLWSWSGTVDGSGAVKVPRPEGMRPTQFNKHGEIVLIPANGTDSMEFSFLWEDGYLKEKITTDKYNTEKVIYKYDQYGNLSGDATMWLENGQWRESSIVVTYRWEYVDDGRYRQRIQLSGARLKEDNRQYADGYTDYNALGKIIEHVDCKCLMFHIGGGIALIAESRNTTCKTAYEYSTNKNGDDVVSEYELKDRQFKLKAEKVYSKDTGVLIEWLDIDLIKDGVYIWATYRHEYDEYGNWQIRKAYKKRYKGTDEQGKSIYNEELSGVNYRSIEYFD